MSRVDYEVIMPDGTRATGHVNDWPAEPSLQLLKALLRPLLAGAEPEHVTVEHEGEQRDMFVDEESALKPLERNPAATAIYLRHYLRSHPEAKAHRLPEIYGTAILFKQRVWR